MTRVPPWMISGVGVLCACATAQSPMVETPVEVAPQSSGVQPKRARIEQGTFNPRAFGLAHEPTIGKISVYTEDNEVWVEWSFDRRVYDAIYDQTFPVDFWPTAALYHKGALIVAGRNTKDAKTRIERWELSYPALQEGARSYSADVVKETVYEEAAAGRTSVRFLGKLLGTPNPKGQVFVHFADSNDVYNLNLDSGVLTFVVGADQLPKLATSGMHSLRHAEVVDMGYVYFYSAVDPYAADYVYPTFVDSNQDGIMDAFHGFSAKEFSARIGYMDDWLNYYENRSY